MNLRIKRDSLLIYSSLFLLIISTYLYLTNEYAKYQKYLLIVGVLMGSLSVFLSRKYSCIKKEEKYRLLSWVILIVWILSGLVNRDFELVINALALFSIYFVFCEIYSRSSITIDNFGRILSFSYLCFLACSYSQKGVSFSSYKGLTYNSNAFGGICTGVFCFCFSYLISKGSKKNYYMVIGAISFCSVIISSSRTSFITCVTILLIGISICRKNILTCLKRNKKSSLALAAVAFLLITCIGSYFNADDIFFDAIIAKFLRKKENPLDGRLEVWIRVWNEKTMWGHGRDYFDHIGLGAHNTFISVLGQYGILAGVLYAGFILSSLISSVKFLSSDSNYRAAPIIFVVSFIIMSMSEGMMMKINMFLFYFGLTIMSKHTVMNRRKSSKN